MILNGLSLMGSAEGLDSSKDVVDVRGDGWGIKAKPHLTRSEHFPVF